MALVTGASRGIGRAIALAFAERGAAVAVNFQTRSEEAQSVVAQIHSAGGRAMPARADVSISAQVNEMVARVTAELGPVDVLVNNAGIAISGVREEDFDLGIAVNLKSAFLCCEAVLPGMCARRWGRIVNISSGAARGPGLLGVVYNASKAGLEGLTRGYASRVAKDGVTGERHRAWPDRHRDGAPLKAGGRRGPHPRRTHGAIGRSGAGDGHGRWQRVHHRSDASRSMAGWRFFKLILAREKRSGTGRANAESAFAPKASAPAHCCLTEI